MNKLFIFLLIAVSLFVSLELSPNTEACKNQPALINLNPTPTPKLSAEIQFVNLSSEEAIIPCPPSKSGFKREGSVCDDNRLIDIETTASNPQNSELTYYYTILDGQIIGQGKNVIWDLKRVRAGSYTITVGIGDQTKVFDKTITKTIKVIECGCCLMPCICPTIDVTGGDVKAGETASFKVEVSAGTQSALTYNWMVSQGEIIEGQGTSEIKVKTTREMTGDVTATVEIGGDFCADCRRTDSETAPIIK